MSFRVAIREPGYQKPYIHLPANVVFAPRTWSASAIGGPETARIPMTGSRFGMEQVLKLVGYRIELYSPNGTLIWWGMIADASFENGNISASNSISKMWNIVTVAYTETLPDDSQARGTTSFAQNSLSTSLYGFKELQLSYSDLNKETAESKRDSVLASVGMPVESSKTGMYGYGKGELICIGIWNTLAWRYYSNPINNVQTETSVQMVEMASRIGLNVFGARVDERSNLYSSPYRDGDSTVQYEIARLMQVGVNNGRRYIGHVDRYDRLQIYHEPLQPSVSNIQIKLNGELSLAGGRWPLGVLPVGKWADSQTYRAGRSSSHVLERVTYDTRTKSYRAEGFDDDPFDTGLEQG